MIIAIDFDGAMFMEPNEENRGWCAARDLYTLRNADEEACHDFVEFKLTEDDD